MPQSNDAVVNGIGYSIKYLGEMGSFGGQLIPGAGGQIWKGLGGTLEYSGQVIIDGKFPAPSNTEDFYEGALQTFSTSLLSTGVGMGIYAAAAGRAVPTR